MERKTETVKSRLAPTPSGLLHPGNGVSFLITWALTRAQGGSLLLRIDDLDKERCRDTYLEDIFRTINWLGIDYDEGPEGLADFKRQWSQHRRMDHYREGLESLRKGGHLFACDCSRRKIREYRADGTYPNLCQERQLDFDRPRVAWRLRLSEEDLRWYSWPEGWRVSSAADYRDAFVVRQKNGRPAYQLASLVDDTHFGINWIVRGQDLQSSTIAQLRLANILEIDSFATATFYHHSLLVGDDGEKLSKSKGAGSLQAWREAGRSPVSLYHKAASLLALPQPWPTDADTLRTAVVARYFSPAASSQQTNE